MKKEKKAQIIVGVSGDKGSFSEEAAQLYIRESGVTAKIIYLTDMEGVLSALSRSKINLGIFPVVNSRGGLVHQAFRAMGKYTFTMIDEIWLDIKQNLITKNNNKKSDISQIVSHPQALAQCERYLRKEFPDVPTLEWQDTAKAAHDLMIGILPENTAVIAPIGCARVYGLTVLQKGIQDMHPNLTTFIVVKK